MAGYNEKNNIEYPEKFRLTRKLIIYFLICLIGGFILYIIPGCVYIYILYNCFLGLSIGSAISSGLRQNNSVKKFLSIPTFIYFFIAYSMLVIFIIIYINFDLYIGFDEFLFTKNPILLFFYLLAF
jgi:hypothetical protein